MSKLMLVFGIIFLALGVALGFLIEFQPGQMQVLALTPEVAALFLVGGALCWGLGDVAGALREGPTRIKMTAPVVEQTELSGSTPATPTFKGFGTKTKAASAVILAEAAEAVVTPTPAANTNVADTISALEQAKSDIATALGVEPAMPQPRVAQPEPPPPAPLEITIAKVEPEPESPAAEPDTDETEDDAELYVVEEKVIRGRPARVLSDGTVEAETDEGWMRFENLEHLDEYIGAMGTSDT
jgi:hypothetical protein